jgi:hypothetical protein
VGPSESQSLMLGASDTLYNSAPLVSNLQELELGDHSCLYSWNAEKSSLLGNSYAGI